MEQYTSLTAGIPYLVLDSDSHSFTPPSSESTLLLEAISEAIGPTDTGDALSRFLGGRRNAAVRTVEDIVLQMSEREWLREQSLAAIDRDECLLRERIYSVEIWAPDWNPARDPVRLGFEKEIRALEKERRQEDLACWRDLNRLRGDLREAAKELSQIRGRDALLRGDP